MMLRNLASMSGLSLFKAAIQFGIGTLLAVFVLPAEYGLITFSLPIIQFITLLTDMGLASAIVRQPGLTPRQSGGALSFSLAVGFAAALLLGLTAYPIEHWTGLAGLGPVLIALAVAIFFTIAAGVPRAIMERALRYQRIAAIEAASTVVAALACTVSVLLGAGIWAVVVFHIILQGLRSGGFLIDSRHAIAFNMKWRDIAQLLGFGSWVLATNLVNFGARNAQNLLIGTAFGATAVGLYGLAYQFMILPLMAIAWPGSGVLLATLSNGRQGSDEHFQRPVLGISLITALVAFPLMMWMTFGLAFPVRALLAPSWAEMIPLIQILAPLGAIQALASYNGAVLLGRGHARLQFKINLISSLSLMAGFVLSLPYGVQRFAEVYLVVGVAVALGQIGAKLWAAKISAGTYIRTLAPAIAATALAAGVALIMGRNPASWTQWIEVSTGYGMAVATIYLLSARSILRDVRALTHSRAPALA